MSSPLPPQPSVSAKTNRLAERTTRRRIVPGPEDADAAEQIVLVALTGPAVGRIYRLHQLATLIGRADEAHVQVCDSCVSRRHAVVVFDPEAQAYRVSDLGSENGTTVNGQLVVTDRQLKVGDKIDVGGACLLRVGTAQDGETQFAETMLQATRRDPLTGSYNRRYFDERVAAEVSFATRHGTEVSLLLIDLDHFKRVNDSYGHSVGDALLRQLGPALQAHVRTEDVVARYGGEEFAVLCRGTDVAGACILGSRLREAINALRVPAGDTQARTTASVGVAALRAHSLDSAARLVEAADQALYQAKHDGRDRTVDFGELPGRAPAT